MRFFSTRFCSCCCLGFALLLLLHQLLSLLYPMSTRSPRCWPRHHHHIAHDRLSMEGIFPFHLYPIAPHPTGSSLAKDFLFFRISSSLYRLRLVWRVCVCWWKEGMRSVCKIVLYFQFFFVLCSHAFSARSRVASAPLTNNHHLNSGALVEAAKHRAGRKKSTTTTMIYAYDSFEHSWASWGWWCVRGLHGVSVCVCASYFHVIIVVPL